MREWTLDPVQILPMENTADPSRRRSPLFSGALILVLGAIIAPVAVYLFGVLLIAPYEGDGALLGFLGDVYGDAAAGEAAAWGLLLSPAALILTWWVVIWLWRRGRPTPDKVDKSSAEPELSDWN